MRKILVALVLAALVAGCARQGTSIVDGVNVTINQSSKAMAPDKILEIANATEATGLFLNLFPGATREAALSDFWVVTYKSGGNELKIKMDKENGTVISTTPKVDYLKSGKYCEDDSDCANVGGTDRALCVNNYYVGGNSVIPCDTTYVQCGKSIACCDCAYNRCVEKKIARPTTSDCAVKDISAAGGGTTAGAATSGSGIKPCSAITELEVGKTVTSGNNTLEFKAVYQEGISYRAKFTVNGETGYVSAGVPVVLGRVKVSVSNIMVSAGGGNGFADVSLDGMGTDCRIS